MPKNNEFRCLAVRQPYAWAICAGEKNIENRVWKTDYRGDIVIVASASTAYIRATQKAVKPVTLSADHLALGAAIGIATLVDVVPLSPELEANPWAFGPYCWKLANGHLFEKPIPCKGKLNLYAPDDDLAKKILKQLPTARKSKLDASGKAWIKALTSYSEEERLGYYMNGYFAIEDWQNVLRHTSRVLELDPDNPYIYGTHGATLIRLERYQEALATLNEAVKRFPDIPEIYDFRAITFERLGDKRSAARDEAKVLKLDPHFFDGIDASPDGEP